MALTWEGLRRLGLPADALTTFPRPLQEGMVTPHRSRILGDVDDSDPSRWSLGGSGDADEIHVLVMVFALTETALAADLAARRDTFEPAGGGLEIVQSIDGRWQVAMSTSASPTGYPSRSSRVGPHARPR